MVAGKLWVPEALEIYHLAQDPRLGDGTSSNSIPQIAPATSGKSSGDY
jgi:hypothetical protein